MKPANPAASVLNSVDHDVRTSRNSVCSRTLVVFIGWIRNVQREMETALLISAIDLVDSFGRFHVAFFLLRACRVPTQSDSVGLDLFAIAKD